MIGADPGRVLSTVTLDNWQSSAHLHWTFQHVADFLPTALISRGAGAIASLPAQPAGIGDLEVTLPDDKRTTVSQVMGTTATDGWIVSHRGSIISESYYGGMTPGTQHLLMSVSKSLIAMVVGALNLDVNAPITTYIPALAVSGYNGATVQHLLDMRSGIKFSENYLDPLAEVRMIEQAIGWAPRTVPDLPNTMYDFLATLQQKSPHGGAFEYRSCETDVLGWVCEAASGKRMPELMSELLWSKIGARYDASISVDPAGAGMFDGGINACLTDLVRFGSLYLSDGVSLTGEKVVPSSWIADTLAGAPDSREAFANSPDDLRMPGGMYRNQVWFPYPDNNVLLCLGIHGQMIYINRSAEVVAAKLSSWPLPQNAQMLFSTIRAFDAIAAAVS